MEACAATVGAALRRLDDRERVPPGRSEAANVILTHPVSASDMKTWALGVAMCGRSQKPSPLFATLPYGSRRRAALPKSRLKTQASRPSNVHRGLASEG